MIRAVTAEDLAVCAEVIRESFLTVAKEFGITPENAPRFTAFAISEDRLLWQFNQRRPMYGAFLADRLVGYYSLELLEEGVCELNNLCVLPELRHNSLGGRLLEHACQTAKVLGCTKVTLGLVEENVHLRNWYEQAGFVHTRVKKFDFFPFTCGYMEKSL